MCGGGARGWLATGSIPHSYNHLHVAVQVAQVLRDRATGHHLQLQSQLREEAIAPRGALAQLDEDARLP